MQLKLRRIQIMSSNLANESEQVEVRPVAGKIGAEVGGVRLSGKLESATIKAIRQALLQYKVLFFRGQDHLDEAAQEAFGRLLGDLAPHPTVPVVSGTESVLDINSERGARAIFWHSDVTFVDAYPSISILRALVVPPYGGDTVWANTAAAYQSLPEKLRELADTLWAVHTNAYDYVTPKGQSDAVRKYYDVARSTVFETEHPVVRIHPETGERTLLLGHFIQKFVGLSTSDSAHLFAVLQGHVTRFEHTVRWRWSKGDVAIWDNRATQHILVDDYGDQPRVLRRVTITGDVPSSIDGKRSVIRSKRPLVPAEPAGAQAQ
jgi:alpha-ketoglutarate-dependent taurine dioxygenase